MGWRCDCMKGFCEGSGSRGIMKSAAMVWEGGGERKREREAKVGCDGLRLGRRPPGVVVGKTKSGGGGRAPLGGERQKKRRRLKRPRAGASWRRENGGGPALLFTLAWRSAAIGGGAPRTALARLECQAATQS